MFTRTPNPFLWVSVGVTRLTGFSFPLTIVLISNLFFLLFLREIVELISRMETTAVAHSAATFCVLWPTSYEMSMGSSFSMACYLAVVSIRTSMDSKWLLSGLSLGLLWLMSPVAISLLVLITFIFWYFQRHFPRKAMAQAAAMFFVPVLIAVVWKAYRFSEISSILGGSALFNLFENFGGGEFAWTFSHSLLGQTFTIILLLVGAIWAAANHSTLLHRVIPPAVAGALLLSFPYDSIVSRAPMAGVCFEGFASSIGPTPKILAYGLTALSVYEVYVLFS